MPNPCLVLEPGRGNSLNMYQLSPDYTYVKKYGPLIFLIPVWILGTIILYFIKLKYCFFLAGFGAFFIIIHLYQYKGIRNVSFDAEYLYIYGIIKKDKVSLTQIEKIEEQFFRSRRIATIILKAPCKFGKEILYFQKTKLFQALNPHPDTILLRETIEHRRKVEYDNLNKCST